MGSYLSQPVTAKESEAGAGGAVEWGSSCMQGWRVGMEDAHFAATGLQCSQSPGTRYSLFGVFDGHGGREVALFCKAHLPDDAKAQLQTFHKTEDIVAIDTNAMAGSLVQTFNNMDDMLRKPEYESEILSFRKNADDQGPDPGGLSSASTEAGSSELGNEEVNQSSAAPSQVEQVQSRLQAAIAVDMARAKDRGSLSKQEAMRIAMGMQFLQRLDGQAAATSSAPCCAAMNVGCTAVCVAITESHVICANAGDSRAVLSRGGRAVSLSHDHKPNDRKERTRIEAAGSIVKEIKSGGARGRIQYRVNGDLNLSRAIGDLRHKQRPDLRHDQQAVSSTPDIHIEARDPSSDEFVVLACDGVWDVRTNAQVCDFVRQGLAQSRPMVEIIEELLDACLSHDPKATQGLGGDNMTCMVVKFDSFDPQQADANKPRGCLLCRCVR